MNKNVENYRTLKRNKVLQKDRRLYLFDFFTEDGTSTMSTSEYESIINDCAFSNDKMNILN
ncbi:hypothetical protein [Vagococcus fluvialis]|uniref:hypothetical protein n=1 Tax=Vagococcus fluvialis TaxID=2738 RepID=UPI000B35C5CF|nr:hypothetical protein [Vagococcus fluvialis]